MQLPLAGIFGDPAIADAFSEQSAIDAWLEVERALAHAQAEAIVDEALALWERS